MVDKDVEFLVKDVVANLLSFMNFEFAEISITNEEENIIRVNIETKSSSLLIGGHGDTLNSFQTIVKNILWNKDISNDIFIIIDVDGYKKTRESKMVDLAKHKAELAKKTGVPQLMPIMEAYLRRIIHLTFAQDDYKEFSTESIGSSGTRRLKISYDL